MAKFCTRCGSEINDNAVVCVKCGCSVENQSTVQTSQNTDVQQNKKQISLIFGIIGIVFAWLFALIGHITSIVGIVLGVKEYKESGKVTGLVFSIIGEVCSVISSIIGVVTVLGAY